MSLFPVGFLDHPVHRAEVDDLLPAGELGGEHQGTVAVGVSYHCAVPELAMQKRCFSPRM